MTEFEYESVERVIDFPLSFRRMLGIRRADDGERQPRVDVIPRWINEPMDDLAVKLFGLFAPIGLKVAHLDKQISEKERYYIKNYFLREWGYSEPYLHLALPDAEKNLEKVNVIELVDDLHEFTIQCDDCNPEEMSKELREFLKEVTRADGELYDIEIVFIQWLEVLLTNREPGLWERLRGAVGIDERPNIKAHERNDSLSGSDLEQSSLQGDARKGETADEVQEEGSAHNVMDVNQKFRRILFWRK